MLETQIQSLGWEDPWRGKWCCTPVLLSGESHGQRSLVGYIPWGHKESDMTDHLSIEIWISVQFSHSVVSNSLWPRGLQHARLSYHQLCSNSCPSSCWCHPTFSYSVVAFSSCLQSFPASESFPMSQFFTSGGQSIGASVSVLPMNSQDWFPLGLTGLISLKSKGLSRVFSNITVQKHQLFGNSLGKTLLAFALLHFVLQRQTCLIQISREHTGHSKHIYRAWINASYILHGNFSKHFCKVYCFVRKHANSTEQLLWSDKYV